MEVRAEHRQKGVRLDELESGQPFQFMQHDGRGDDITQLRCRVENPGVVQLKEGQSHFIPVVALANGTIQWVHPSAVVVPMRPNKEPVTFIVDDRAWEVGYARG
jgi:hypothetical protein